MTTLLSVVETCGRLGISDSTLRRMLKSGALEAVRVGRQVRIPEASLDRLIAKPAPQPRAAA